VVYSDLLIAYAQARISGADTGSGKCIPDCFTGKKCLPGHQSDTENGLNSLAKRKVLGKKRP